MEKMGEREEEYSLRFINVTLGDIEPIKKLIPDELFNVRRYFKNQNRYVATVDLKENLDYQAIEETMNKNAQGIDCDVFVSISSDSDSEIIGVPIHVIEFIRNTKCGLTFSFTVID